MEYFAGSLAWSFDLAGDKLLERRLEGVLPVLNDWRPVFEEMAPLIYRHLRQVFETEGGAARGGAWVPLTERYRKWKERHYPGMPILTATKKLQRSLTDKDDPNAIYAATSDHLVIGTKVRTPNGDWNLGLIHQKGTTDGRVPARPIISFPDSLTGELTTVLRKKISWE